MNRILRIGLETIIVLNLTFASIKSIAYTQETAKPDSIQVQDQNEQQYQYVNIKENISLGYWVDVAGNTDKGANGTIDDTEEKEMQEAFKQAYLLKQKGLKKESTILVVTKSPLDDYEPLITSLPKIFPSEQKLKEAYSNISFRDGITIWEIDRAGTIINARAAYGGITRPDNRWEIINSLPKLDYTSRIKKLK